MTMIEIILLLVGCVFMIGSFFISEKLSSSELNKIAELSEDELKKIIEREVNNAGTQMDEVIEQKIEEAGEQAERAMEKESNEQIMQIHEYSETVMESMKKTHDEIMFLYSMLNDKHTEMTSMTGDLQRLAADIRNLQENLSAKAGTSIRKPVAESHVVQQPVMKQNAVVQPMTETIDVQPEPEVQVNRFQEIQEPEQKTEKPETKHKTSKHAANATSLLTRNVKEFLTSRYDFRYNLLGKSSVSCPLKPSDSTPLKHSTMPP